MWGGNEHVSPRGASPALTRPGLCRLQQQVGEQQSWARLYCVLRGSNLLCYRQPQDAEAPVEPALTIAINKVRGAGSRAPGH